MPNPYLHIDLSYLESITDGNKDIINELVTIFIEQVPEFTEGFATGFENEDWIKIAAVAHKAKSSVISMGMDKLGNEDLKNLELIAKQLRIIALENQPSDSSTLSEIEKLRKNFNSYPEDRKEWILKNTSNNIVKELIDRFNFSCTEAIKELNQVLES